MEFEFDKEIDSLLRRAATGESVQTFDAHPDADEISLFAENALTAKARVRTVNHLAECAKCRKILSHLISFNAESESETIHAEESNIIPVVAPAIPWYRKLFAFPQITFAMGALVLVFSGIMAFLVLQTANESGNVSVAKREEIRETMKGTSGADSDGETSSVETYAANSTANVSPGMMSNSNAAMNTVSSTTASNTASVSGNSANIAPPAVRQQPQAEKNEETDAKREDSSLLDVQPMQNAAPQNKPNITAGAPVPPKDNNQPQPIDRSRDDDERKLSSSDVVTESQATRKEMPKSAVKKSALEDKNKAGESRIGGKTFRNVGGIWFDSAYTSQQQIMIRRGSDDYRRLDSGLRSIAESLSGTVVVVWKSKAYRIN